MTDDALRSALSGWPPSAPLPRRLLALMKLMTGPSYVTLGDFDALDLDDDYLAGMWAQDPARAPLFQAYFRSTPAKVGFFAKGGDGGHLGLWMRGAPEDWPVVHIDSEGSTEILGETLDEYLRIVAAQLGTDDPDNAEPYRTEMRAFILAEGLTPHERPQDRRQARKALTLEFLRWSAEEQRIIRSAVLPDWVRAYDVEPGGAVGPLRAGDTQEAVDAALGTPHFARWQKPTDRAMTAFYDRSPFTVDYVRATRRVDRIDVYSQWALLRFPGGFEPLLAAEADVERWLGAHHPGLPVNRTFREIDVPALGLKFILNEGCDPAQPPPPLRWVDNLEFRVPEPR